MTHGLLSPAQLEEHVAERLRSLGWAEPTPIQRKAFPVLVRRRNALLVAPTGSGKTEAAVLPSFATLAAERHISVGIRMLYVTPLRALNRDILRRILGYGAAEGLRVEVRHGDTPQTVRHRMARAPPDVLVTTPETLAIVLTSRNLRQQLRAVEWVVVDELHELLGSERGAHLAVSLERLEALTQAAPVRVGLSATVGDLQEAASFLCGEQRGYAILVDPGARHYRVTCEFVEGPFVQAAERILTIVRSRLGPGQSALLFTNTRDEAESLGAVLGAKSPDFPVDVHHGSLSRDTREETESRLRGGEAGLVVCTSSLELGLDIGAVDLVIHWGSARQAVKLLQRVGRSRHRRGADAVGLVVTNRADDELEAHALVERIERGWLEASEVHHNALDVVAHQVAGLVLERGLVRVEEALTLLRRAYPFRQLAQEDLVASVELLARQGVVRFDGEILRRRGPTTYTYYYENISTIPDIQQFEVVDVTKKRTVGRLDQMFVGEYGEPGKLFILRGQSWKILSIDDEKRVVHVEPTFRDLSTVPYWIGELIPVDLHTAREVGRLRRQIARGRATDVASAQQVRLAKTRERLEVLPDEQTIVIERKRGGNTVVVHGCFGSKVNQTLATMLSTLIAARTGFLVEARSDPYRIVLSSQGALSPTHVRQALVAEVDLPSVLSAAVVGTHPLNWKTWYVAKKFGVLTREAQYDRRAARLIQERYRNTALYKEVLRELFVEKYDVNRARDILTALRERRLRIVERDVEEWSPLAEPILEYVAGFAALPVTVEQAVLDLVRERLEKAKHHLVCLSCGQWESIRSTLDIPEPIACARCHSRLVADTYVSDTTLVKVAQKRQRGVPLTPEEEHQYRRAWKTASLLQQFGRRALFALAGYGVGPDTAARILRRTLSNDDLLRNIYRAEKTYVMTRGFWDD